MPLELVSLVVQNLVAHPEEVSVRADEQDNGTRIEIRCAEGDAGRVIGRGGRLINALRTLARAAADGRQRIDVHLLD